MPVHVHTDKCMMNREQKGVRAGCICAKPEKLAKPNQYQRLRDEMSPSARAKSKVKSDQLKCEHEKDLRSELAIKRDEWLASEEGRECLDYSTLTGAIYLEHRINRAFMAGVRAESKSSQEICDKIADSVTSPEELS